jgi:hypothetical protein
MDNHSTSVHCIVKNCATPNQGGGLLYLLLIRVVAINGRKKANMFVIVPIRTFAFKYNVYDYIKDHIDVNNKNTFVKPLADIRVFGQCSCNPVLDKTW